MLWFIIFVAALFGGIDSDPRSVHLDNVDFTDSAQLARLHHELSPRDRRALSQFVVEHWANSKHFCGRPLVTGGGDAPQNIGEAIDLTLSREAEQLAESRAALQPQSASERAAEAWTRATAERELLLESRSRMVVERGPPAKKTRAWKRLERALADVDERLVDFQS